MKGEAVSTTGLPGPQGPIHWAWIILAVCFVNLLINYSVRLGYGLVLPEMIRDLSLSRTAGGTIFNSYFFMYLALTPLTGYLTDWFGARRVISVCALIMGAGIILMGTVDSLATACLVFGLVGLGSTGMWTPIISVVLRWFAPRRRGLALGVLSTSWGLGFAALGVTFPWVVHNFNWRFTWYFLGAASLFMVAVNAFLLRSDPASSGYSPWGQDSGAVSSDSTVLLRPRAAHLSQMLKDRTFWLIGLSYMFTAYGFYGFNTFMVDYARHQVGMPVEKASFLATVSGLGQVVGVLTILPLSDRLGRKRALLIANSFITVLLVGLLFTGQSLVMLYVLVGVLAVFCSATFPMYSACAGDYFPREMMATVVGAWTPFYGLGAMAAHWVSGMLRDATGDYHYPFIINAFMAGLAVVMMSRVKQAER
ncbi:MAG: MFS transporter [Pseudomonadota bacterium]